MIQLPYLVVVIFALLSFYFAVKLNQARRKLLKSASHKTADQPSVSVCIPARNEAHALSACLDRVLASDYEKLEILVLDDESVDQTPTLIKSFAHAGVRFIPGKHLTPGWIGKNHALDTLVREASGDIVLFLDVDVRISSSTISQLIKALPKEGHVISVIPQRWDTYRASAIFGHMRYLWDLMQVAFDGKSATASLWAVRRQWLMTTFDGLGKIKSVIRPELAAISSKDTTAVFLLGNGMGVSYEKHWRSQTESSERLLVPTVRHYLRSSKIVILWMVLGFLSLAFMAYDLIVLLSPMTVGFALLTYFAGYIVLVAYLRLVWQTRAWLGALLWAWACLQELILLIASALRYATKTVTWKGRSIHAQPSNDDYLSI